MPSSTKYIPFGPNGAVAFWIPATDRIQGAAQLSSWAEKGIKTVVCVFSEKGSSLVTELEESLHAGEWKLFALEIPPGPETNESVFFSSWKLISATAKSNVLFLIPPELSERWEVLLSKMVLASYPHIATGELSAWFPSLAGGSEETLLGEFKAYASRKKAPKEIPDSTRGEFSVFLKELPLAVSGIELGVFQNGNGKDGNGKKKLPKIKEKSDEFRTLETKPVISFDTVFSGEKPSNEAETASSAPTPTGSSAEALPSPKVEKEKTQKQEPKKEAPKSSEEALRTSAKFPLQLKLMGVISLLLTLTVSTVILYASSEFKKNYEVRVLETNFSLVNILGIKVKSDLKDIRDKGKTLTEKLLDPKGPGAYADLFFRNEPDFLLAGIYSAQGQKLKKKVVLYNDSYLEGISSNRNELDSAIEQKESSLIKSIQSGGRIDNLTPNFKEPAFSISVYDASSNSILIYILRSERLLSVFQKQDINVPFLINGDGDLIAHHDLQLLAAQTNWADLPIFETMLSSVREDSQQTRYEDSTKTKYYGSYQKLGFGGAGVIVSVPEEKVFEMVYRIQTKNLLIMAIALCVALIIVFFLARNITIPILKLLSATIEIAKGNFRIGIRSTTRDEIGVLTDYFVNMGKGLEEREKVKDALGRFVNKEIAEMVLNKELTLGGERKMCAIFFSDIRSFTAISEKLQPEEVVEFLNEYMTEMVQCVNETHGIVDKFIGDAIMATWGAVRSSDQDAENAVNGALLMRKALLRFNQGRGGDKKPIIRIGCGLNFGPVIAGQIGSEERLEYTVIGDAVNLASRVEALNKPFGTDVLITQDLYDRVRDIFAVEKMQAIKVKGKEDPQQIYAVLGRKDDPDRPVDINDLRKRLGIEYESKKKPKTGDAEEELKYEILD
ncbi:HAMP domain-containing protein [Leptospira langatensis]|uniref:HAMP domain-containing protein n=1 Tax=Leptospira langatensis TaxID=2484983 RepID=A0A5F1ZX36_9LEPT|nr:adenylate/guanylate cyclase domain-containing protein [Leptospira langatensis]TGJ98520.1 HAMP domain-containing protein [Leptospira langatensis]TGL43435.1 HAMP domain-containing protein [Leptospira langatensis]